jgi:outer membrane protein OmpA-like peptidoglycan-associated protein
MPVRFREALAGFQQCTAKLLYLDFEPLDEQTVFFATNSDRLNLAARRILEVIALNHRRQPGLRLVLGGHADERGEAAYNLDLSRRRAAAVAHYLRARGVPAAAIESRYFGETLPVDRESRKEAWAKNRRVTVWLAEKPADS